MTSADDKKEEGIMVLHVSGITEVMDFGAPRFESIWRYSIVQSNIRSYSIELDRIRSNIRFWRSNSSHSIEFDRTRFDSIRLDQFDFGDNNPLKVWNLEIDNLHKLLNFLFFAECPSSLVTKTFRSQGFDVCLFSDFSFHRANGTQSSRAKARGISQNTMRIDRHLRMLETVPS
jgi:hypothetical protein